MQQRRQAATALRGDAAMQQRRQAATAALNNAAMQQQSLMSQLEEEVDIEYLLALQNLRESLPDVVEKFFLAISTIGDGPALAVVLLVVYWCIDKRTGLVAVTSFCISGLVGNLLKNIVCSFRPWLADTRITPAPEAIPGAHGYSFPSAHAQGNAAVAGAIAWEYRKRHRVLAILLVVYILLVGFSRNFLGVHMPQDVIVGLGLAVVGIFLAYSFFGWIERLDAEKPGHNADVIACFITVALACAAVAFVVLKPYPSGYINGVLVIDADLMQKGMLETAGVVIGVAVGWLLERRFVGFTTEGSLTAKQRVVRVIVGAAVVGIAFAIAYVAFKTLLPYNWAKLCTFTVVAIIAVAAAPAVFKRIESKLAARDIA